MLSIARAQEIKKEDRMNKERRYKMKKIYDFWPLAKDFSQRFPHKISSLQATKESVEVLGVANVRNKDKEIK